MDLSNQHYAAAGIKGQDDVIHSDNTIKIVSEQAWLVLVPSLSLSPSLPLSLCDGVMGSCLC